MRQNTLKVLSEITSHRDDAVRCVSDAIDNDRHGIVVHVQRNRDGTSYVFSGQMLIDNQGAAAFFRYLSDEDVQKAQSISSMHDILVIFKSHWSANFTLNAIVNHPDDIENVASALATFAKKNAISPCAFSIVSGHQPALKTLSNRYPNLPRGLLLHNTPLDYAASAVRCDVHTVYLPADYVDPAFVRDAQQHGIAVCVIGLTHFQQAGILADMQVGAIAIQGAV